MKKIKLRFTEKAYVTALLADPEFIKDKAVHLNPIKVDDYHIMFTDPVEGNNEIDTEEIALRVSSQAINRIFFSGNGYISFLNSDSTGMKKGTRLDTPIIIDSVVEK